ncbi:MAG: ZIP family metal transporter [Clostridia bacterium]|nr:ZIP family metal transporter [Clostridia bacterium]
MKKEPGDSLRRLLTGFAAGVMIAASVWSLLLPAIDASLPPRWLQPTAGFLFGCAFLMVCESVCARMQKAGNMHRSAPTNHKMLLFAVTLHNIPEGLAVGVGVAAALKEQSAASMAAAFGLALGIAIQNFPEGAIISLPLSAEGYSKPKAFLFGVLSGAVEPVSALVTLLLTALVIKVLPFMLAFAAGAMVYVCVSELIPETKGSGKINAGVVGFIAGFLLMMVLDVSL